MKLKVSSDSLWRKLGGRFPERSVVVEVAKALEELGEVADLALRIHGRQRQQETMPEEELRKRMEKEISDVIITLVMMAKDLGIDIWEALEERMLAEIERPL